MQDVLAAEVDRYVQTGEHDNHLFVGWPGANLAARGEQGHAALASALVAEVRKRMPHATGVSAAERRRCQGLDIHDPQAVALRAKRA